VPAAVARPPFLAASALTALTCPTVARPSRERSATRRTLLPRMTLLPRRTLLPPSVLRRTLLPPYVLEAPRDARLAAGGGMESAVPSVDMSIRCGERSPVPSACAPSLAGLCSRPSL